MLVDIEHRRGVRRLRLLGESFVHHSGVVDQNVEIACVGYDLIDAPPNRLVGADVEPKTPAPRSANNRAVANPIPDDAPVTRIVR